MSLVRLDWSKFGIQRIIIARYIIAQCKYPPFSYITQNRRCLCISNKKDTSHSYIYFFSNLFQYINLDLFPIFDAIKSLSIIGITWSKKSMDLIRFASHNSRWIFIMKRYLKVFEFSHWLVRLILFSVIIKITSIFIRSFTIHEYNTFHSTINHLCIHSWITS